MDFHFSGLCPPLVSSLRRGLLYEQQNYDIWQCVGSYKAESPRFNGLLSHDLTKQS